MIGTPAIPGLYYRNVPKRAEPSPLRSDVAGFVGRTRRGDPGKALRVEGWRDYQTLFGGLDPSAPMSYSIRGYFENGGQVAYVVRVLEEDAPTYQSDLTLEIDSTRFRLQATSPGEWSKGLVVTTRKLRVGKGGGPAIEFAVRGNGEPEELFQCELKTAPLPNQVTRHSTRQASRAERLLEEPLPSQVARQSRYVWLEIVETPTRKANGGEQKKFQLKTPKPSPVTSRPVAISSYLDGLVALGDQPEVALIAAPDLATENPESASSFYVEAIRQAAELQDRLVLIDLPCGGCDPRQFVDDLRREIPDDPSQSFAAIYSPSLRVADPIGLPGFPWRDVSPSGHIAGVISRVDRERGAHHTPANVYVEDAVDLACEIPSGRLAEFHRLGINTVRCQPGRGLVVWGGRTLSEDRSNTFLAHRRFLQRLVRVIRRVADPIVFDTNGPEIWLMLVRAISTVLLEAFRSGALKGERPEEAFRVRCDDGNNPYIQREEGRLSCEIDLALAAPMEFITLKVSVSETGQVEVFDS